MTEFTLRGQEVSITLAVAFSQMLYRVGTFSHAMMVTLFLSFYILVLI